MFTMSNFYDDLLNQIDNEEEIEVDAPEAPEEAESGEEDALEEPVANLDTPVDPLTAIKNIDVKVKPKAIRKVPIKKTRDEDEKYNLLKSVDEFTKPLYDGRDEVLSEPVTTTVTLSGRLLNVSFHEQELITKLEPTGNVVMLKCNYGTKTQDNWEEPSKVKKSNRGRKKQEKPKKRQRKIQGTGECFNSQLTFVMRQMVPAHLTKSATYYEFYSGNKDDTPVAVYFKIKVFRTGVIQIPGARPDLLPYIVASCEEICEHLNKALTPPDSDKRVTIGRLHAVMKDYKFYVSLQKGQMLDLYMLKLIFTVDKLRQNDMLYLDGEINDVAINNIMAGLDEDGNQREQLQDYSDAAMEIIDWMKEIPKREPPVIEDIKYTYEETKLALIFSTPLPWKPAKTTRVNIFLGGQIAPPVKGRPGIYGAKIDILGALEYKVTRKIYKYLLDVFERYFDMIVIEPSTDDNEYVIIEETQPENVADDRTPTEIVIDVKKMYGRYREPLPVITSEMLACAQAYLDDILTHQNVKHGVHHDQQYTGDHRTVCT